jgi:peptide/nickel transport system substrate-binding protein
MKKLRWQFVLLLITGLVVGILLINQQKSVTPESTAIVPIEGGSYTEALIGNVVRLNPLLDEFNSVDNDVDSLLYSSMLKFDSRGLPYGDLVDSWGISQDGTQYNFSLKSNITWHDGEPLTAKDIVFTVKLLQEASSILPSDMSAFWKEVEVQQLSDSLVQFRIPEAYSPFLDYLTFGVLPEHLLNGLTVEEISENAFNLNPVGSGPYKFDHFMVEDGNITGVVISANTNYYENKPYINEITFKYYPDDQAAYAAYQAGDVNGISNVNQDILTNVLAEPGLSIYTARQSLMEMIYLNLNNSEVQFFSDAKLRQALMMGINRSWIIKTVFLGQAIMANGPIMPGNWAYYDGLTEISYDTEAAKALLIESGYVYSADGATLSTKDGVLVSFTLLYPDDSTHESIAKAVQRDWRSLGISVEIQAMSYDGIIEDQLDTRTYQAALVDINLSSSPDPDPYPFWDQAQATGSGQNYSQWNNQNASQYLEDARVSTDITERTRLYRNFQVIFQDEMPSLPLFFPVYTYAIDNHILGVQMGPIYKNSDRFETITNWFFSDHPLTEPVEILTVVP